MLPDVTTRPVAVYLAGFLGSPPPTAVIGGRGDRTGARRDRSFNGQMHHPADALPLPYRTRMLRITHLLLLVAATACATRGASPPPPSVDASAVTGRYQVLWAKATGCTLDVGPVAADTMRIQLYCSRGPPSWNLGFLDARLPLRGDGLTYTTDEFGGRCVIRIRFTDDAALVDDEAGDWDACGFGYGVRAQGTYTRVSREMPPFNLHPAG